MKYYCECGGELHEGERENQTLSAGDSEDCYICDKCDKTYSIDYMML